MTRKENITYLPYNGMVPLVPRVSIIGLEKTIKKIKTVLVTNEQLLIVRLFEGGFKWRLGEYHILSYRYISESSDLHICSGICVHKF